MSGGGPGRSTLTAAALIIVVAGCDLAATPEPTSTVSPARTPPPPPEGAAPEITGFTIVGDQFSRTLMVRLHNPNEDVGLIRAGFELTVLAADGAIIDILGQSEAPPHGPCCTIYRLPPNGEFGLASLLRASEPPASLELAVTGPWVDWSSVEPPLSEVSDASVSVAASGGGPHVTGRVTTPAAAPEGPFNVWIVAFVDSPFGQLVLTDSIDCVNSPDPRTFSIATAVSGLQGPYTLESIVAYTTTVPGVTNPAFGC